MDNNKKEMKIFTLMILVVPRLTLYHAVTC